VAARFVLGLEVGIVGACEKFCEIIHESVSAVGRDFSICDFALGMTTARRGLGRLCLNPKMRQRGSDDPDSMTGNDPRSPFTIDAANVRNRIAKTTLP
jgi:hypothetical protein